MLKSFSIYYFFFGVANFPFFELNFASFFFYTTFICNSTKEIFPRNSSINAIDSCIEDVTVPCTLFTMFLEKPMS